MADRRVQILLDDLVVVALVDDEVGDALVSRDQEPEGFVACLPGLGKHSVFEFLNQLACYLVFLDGLLDVDQCLPFQIRKLMLRLRHVQFRPLDSTLVTVVNRQGNGHAKGP